MLLYQIKEVTFDTHIRRETSAHSNEFWVSCGCERKIVILWDLVPCRLVYTKKI